MPRLSRNVLDNIKSVSLHIAITKSATRFSRRMAVAVLLVFCLILPAPVSARKKRRPPAGGRVAVVVDERLAALRDAPDVSAAVLQRLSRGRAVAVTGARNAHDGLLFYRVNVTRRTNGWLQADAVASPSRAGDDERLLRLVRGSEDFDRLARARIFLDIFPRSPSRPAALLFYGDAAEEAAAKLSREAQRRLDEREMAAGGAPVASYYMNYVGLDRYRKQGVAFVFDRAAKQFHYDGWAWREIVRRHPRSPEAKEARRHLDALAAPPPS
ncbi:MAG: hypothetical protein LC754_11425 [Acidobacteria bacterium]|nr:hypothetical protein [Acidobacteriota bacterium]